MPTYDFECPKCSSKFEKRRSFSETSPVPCPDCGSEAEQLFSPVPIIFKGSGFYVTDHRGSHGHSAPTESSSESDSKKAESPKAETAAESKSTPASTE